MLAVVAAAALGVSPVAPLARPAAAGSAAVPQVRWTACGGGFQCATARVPLDYDHPAGATISLALIRLPASLPRQRIGSLFTNPGGPGGSGVDFVREVAKVLPPQLRDHFDIVGFDPRGVMRSTPLRCFPNAKAAVSVLPAFPFPLTPRQENVQKAADETLASACAARGGPILGHMSTADVARDMDLLRRALGERSMNYLGFSYGSFLGQTYANLFPHQVRTLVIDGVLDPIAWTTGQGSEGNTLPFSTRLRSDVGAQRTLEAFFRLCDAAGPRCAFSGHSRQRFANLAHRLRQHPIVIPDPSGGTFRLTYAGLISTTLSMLYFPVVWPDMAALLAEVEAAAMPAAVVQALTRVRAGLGLDTARQQRYPNYVEGGPGVFCSDSVNPDSFTTWRRAAQVSDRSPTDDTDTSAGRGPGSQASACPGPPGPGRTATWAPGPRGRPHRCWLSGTTSTRRLAIRVP